MGVPEETNLVSFGSQILEKKAERCKALLLLESYKHLLTPVLWIQTSQFDSAICYFNPI